MPIEDDVSILAGRARSIPDALLERARELRHDQTRAEELLWEKLRDRRLNGAKFRRQHDVGQFIADFYCHSSRLIVEADGGIHEQQPERDSIRDEWAQTNGFRVVRITNDEIADDIEAVLRRIAEALTPWPPLPAGEGESEMAWANALTPRTHLRAPSPSGRGLG